MAAKFLIDAISMSHPQPGGYRTYTTNLVRHLQLVDQRNEYVVAVDRPIAWTPKAGWQLHIAERRGSLGVIWREQVAIPRLAAMNGVDLVHSPSATASVWGTNPLLVTLHDTIEFSEPLQSPRQIKRWSMRLYSRRVQQLAVRRARHIVTVSHYSKAQISRYFAIPEDRITVIYNAPSPVFSTGDRQQTKKEVARRWSISGHVLGIASAAKRKNVGAILDAYTLLPETLQRQHPLVLVCTHANVKSEMSRLAHDRGLDDQVRLLEEVSDPDLALLYGAASVFVFPSLEEGFGLPPLEAMSCGAPVVVSNTSSLPEVVGEAGLLVAPTDALEIAEAINYVLTNQALAEELRGKGLARSASFSWYTAAQQTMDVYERIVQA